MNSLNRVLVLSSTISKNSRYLKVVVKVSGFKILSLNRSYFCRLISTSARLGADDGWFSKLLVRRIEPTKESHSRMLSDKEIIYALHTHNIKPDSMDNYLKN